MSELRVLVIGSPGYDDWLSLRAALDAMFDKAPIEGDMVVLAGQDGDDGAPGMAREWAQSMIADKMPVRLEDAPAAPHLTRVDRALVAILAGDPSGVGEAARSLTALSRELLGSGVQVQLVVQGRARGLPEDLVGGPDGRVLGTVTRRTGLNRENPTSLHRPGSGPRQRGH